ncbi:MAG: serine/threonine protein kinase [Gammaproteobacteria bacterium]|nr:serine/threonine protein kinase [Gammaproteobacteria bacterium]
MTDERPFSGLTPDVVLDAIEQAGFECDGRTLALNSYENRVYQIGLEDGSWVVAKFYRPGRWPDAAIDEEHAFSIQLQEHEIPVVAPMVCAGHTLLEHDGFRYAVFPRQGGRWPELATQEDREMMGRFLGRLHAVGASGAFEHRPYVDIERLGHEPREFLLDSDWIPSHITESYAAISDQLIAAVEQVFDQVGTCRELRIHGDCHLGNTLWTDSGPHFVDLDDCLTGPAVQDLWMLLSGDENEMRGQIEDLLQGYEDFYDFDARELRLIEPLRALRMLHYTAWVARRWQDPAFPIAFPWLAENRYWEEHVLNLKEQFAAVQAA